MLREEASTQRFHRLPSVSFRQVPPENSRIGLAICQLPTEPNRQHAKASPLVLYRISGKGEPKKAAIPREDSGTRYPAQQHEEGAKEPRGLYQFRYGTKKIGTC